MRAAHDAEDQRDGEELARPGEPAPDLADTVALHERGRQGLRQRLAYERERVDEGRLARTVAPDENVSPSSGSRASRNPR